MPIQEWRALAGELRTLLSLEHAPLAMTFSADAPAGVPAYEGVMPQPMPDGRTGNVSGGQRCGCLCSAGFPAVCVGYYVDTFLYGAGTRMPTYDRTAVSD
jgi:hypothetical protein